MLSDNMRVHSWELIEMPNAVRELTGKIYWKMGNRHYVCHLFVMKTLQLAWQGIIFLDNPK